MTSAAALRPDQGERREPLSFATYSGTTGTTGGPVLDASNGPNRRERFSAYRRFRRVDVRGVNVGRISAAADTGKRNGEYLAGCRRVVDLGLPYRVGRATVPWPARRA
jgi:hypothetical protein